MNPYGPDQPLGQPPPGHQYSTYSDEPPLRLGPPWEIEGMPEFQKWWQTVREVLLTPAEFFANMRVVGDYVRPAIFLAIGGAISALGGLVTDLAMMPLKLAGGDRNAAAGAAGSLLGNVCVLFLAPILMPLLAFVSAGILHVFLMLLGGAKNGFEATYRVVAYAQGATSLLGLVPCLGPIVSMVWTVVAEIIGMAKAHETDMGRAAGAVLLPTILCCVLAGIIGFLIFGAIIAAAAGAGAAGGSNGYSSF